MRNPWLELPRKPPLVLGEDCPHVEAFNRKAKDDHQLDLELLPEPFKGVRDAPLVLLLLNPGKNDGDRAVHAGPYSEHLRANLGDDRAAQRHLGLRPEGLEISDWWSRRLSALRREGHELDELSRKVLSVEFHGYHSRSWSQLPVTLPSQHYGFWLVESAIERGATIVTMRGNRLWSVAVPRLHGYEKAFQVKNPRAGTLSPGNLGDRRFTQMLRALE